MAVGRRSALGVLLMTACASAASGQDREPYAGAAVVVSTQGSTRPGSSPSFPQTGVGGTAVGVAVEAGGFLARTLSVAFEASIPARFESLQVTSYFLTFRTNSRHRDEIFSGLFRVHLPAAGIVRVSVAGGPSAVRENTLQREAFKTAPFGQPGDFGPFGPELSVRRWTVGITGGVDVELTVSRRLSVVPQMRLHWMERAESGEHTSGFLGLSPWVWRPGVGIRVRF